MINLRSTNELSTKDPLRVMVYGVAGVGKTHLIPTMYNPVIISSEKGLITLASHNLPFIEVATYQDFVSALDFLLLDDRFSTIVIDSLSNKSEMLIRDLLNGKSNAGNKIHGQAAYGMLLEKFTLLFEKMQNANKDIVCFAKMETSKDEEGKEKFGALFAGQKLTSLANHFFDCVLALRKDANGNRFLQSSSDFQYHAKARCPFPLEAVHEPHLGKFLNKIRGIV